MKPTGYFGAYGGCFVPELLIPALQELETTFLKMKEDKKFNDQLRLLFHDYAGRPTPLTFCTNLSRKFNCKIYLKREDLLHTGAHKINNTLGQCLLAKRMGKTRLIAETGAGQHGVATATVAAKFGMKCDIYMGEKDMHRQKQNVTRMRLLGAKVIPVKTGSRTLKDAINEALRDYSAHFATTHYVLGSVLGPHPFPMIVAHFQRVIGEEAKCQILDKEQRLPDKILACVGGGSNALGIFKEFLSDDVQLIGVEGGGKGISSGKHTARFFDKKLGRVGVLHGTKTYVLQDADGQICKTHSVSAGLDYPAVGPEHSFLYDSKRVQFIYARDEEAIQAFHELSTEEGILPALESAHAIAGLRKVARPGDLIIVNLSGRGDKDLDEVMSYEIS